MWLDMPEFFVLSSFFFILSARFKMRIMQIARHIC